MEEQITCLLSGQRSADPGKKPGYGFARAVAAVIMSLLIIPVKLHAADNNTDRYSPDKILSFTRYLAENGEYFRAWTELRRLESYYPGYISSEKFKVTALYLMYKAGRFDEIPGYAAGKETGCAEGVILADSFIMMKDYASALQVIAKNSPLCTGDIIPGMYERGRSYISLVSGDSAAGGSGMIDAETAAYKELVQYREKMNDEKKSPVLAALLGVIPGAGYIYAGDSGTGFTAMAVIAIFGTVAYGSFQNGIEPLGIIAGAVTLFFYGGNIAGGYLEAKRRNREVDDRVEKKAGSVLDLDGDVEKIYIRFGISSNGN